MRVAAAEMPSLPEDPTALRALLLSVIAERDSLAAERDALAVRNQQLHHLLLKLKRRQFGQKSERLPEDQLLFAFEEIEATLAENAAVAGKASPALRDNQAKRRREGRSRLPSHLPRVEQVLAPEATACACCRGPLETPANALLSLCWADSLSLVTAVARREWVSVGLDRRALRRRCCRRVLAPIAGWSASLA